MGGNVGRAVGVDGDDVIFDLTAVQAEPAVTDDDIQVRHVHVEIFAPDLDDLPVDLEAVNLYVGAIDRGRLPRRRACGESDDRHAFDVVGRAVCVEVWSDEELLPGSVVEKDIGMIDRVDALPVVEAQQHVAILLLHLNVVVGGFGLVDLPGVLFEGGIGKCKGDERQCDGHPDQFEHFAAAGEAGESDQGNRKQDHGEEDEGEARTDGGDGDEGGEECADEGAERGDGVDLPGDLTGLFRIVHGEADGEGGDGAEQGDGNDKENQDCNEGARHDADAERFERPGSGSENRDSGIRDESDRERCPSEDAVHGERGGVFIRPFAAEVVAEGKVDEDEPDDARPNEVAGAEDVADEPTGGKFGAEGCHARDEDSEEEVAFHGGGL